MKTENLQKNIFKGLLCQIEESPEDFELYKKLVKMITDNKITWKGVDTSTVAFKAQSGFNNNCSKCKCKMLKGNPVFYQNKVPWCINCASDEDKENTFYKKYIDEQGSSQLPMIRLCK